MNDAGQMVRVLRLGSSAWALLATPVQFLPQADGTIVIGITAVGCRESSLVGGNEPRVALLLEFGRFKQDDVAALLEAADKAVRPALATVT